ncbi:MAG TPA: hypothetical protein PLA25_05110 [Anaerolineaceae bacterium]|nr:hypothetical protein [Anaerolineaceae bacterium]
MKQPVFMLIPNFLKDPKAFYQSVQRNENLKGKALGLLISIVVFLMIYGFVTGLSHGWLQGLSTAIKMPLLFLLTLLFTLPALYFFALALLNVRFSVAQAGIIVLSGIGVSAFLLLGLSPVTLFFVLTSSNYAFFQLVAVIFVAISGVTGLYYVLNGFKWVDQNREMANSSLGNALLRMWVVLYGFVGAQMTWRLSPFIGDPLTPFEIIHPSRDNFFVDVINAIKRATGMNTTTATEIDFVAALFCGGALLGLAIGVGIWLGSRKKAPTAAPAPSPVVQAAMVPPASVEGGKNPPADVGDSPGHG